MSTLRSVRLTQQVLVRVVADILLLNASALTALVLRFLYLVAFEPAPVDVTYNDLFWALVSNYFHIAWLLTGVCLLVFAVSGVLHSRPRISGPLQGAGCYAGG